MKGECNGNGLISKQVKSDFKFQTSVYRQDVCVFPVTVSSYMLDCQGLGTAALLDQVESLAFCGHFWIIFANPGYLPSILSTHRHSWSSPTPCLPLSTIYIWNEVFSSPSFQSVKVIWFVLFQSSFWRQPYLGMLLLSKKGNRVRQNYSTISTNYLFAFPLSQSIKLLWDVLL